MSGLDFSLVYLLAAVLGVVLLRSRKLPSMLGYLLTGTIVGPHLLGIDTCRNMDDKIHVSELFAVLTAQRDHRRSTLSLVQSDD